MQVPLFDVAVPSFLNHLQIERGLAKNSITAYRRDLEKFGNFLAGVTLDAIDAQRILEFELSLRAQGLSSASINRIESTLRSFFRHVQMENGLDDPTKEIVSSKPARRLPKALTISQIVSIIEASFRESHPITSRDRAMLEFLYSSGARVSELIGINISDLSKTVSDGQEITTVKLRGKGAKERIVPIGSFATKAVDDYLIRIRPGLAAKTSKNANALFLNSLGNRISRQTAWQIALNAAAAAGVIENVSPHVFRHSYATHLLDGGADIRVVQELLGHASVTTTQIYTLVTIDKLRESYSSAHPRAR